MPARHGECFIALPITRIGRRSIGWPASGTLLRFCLRRWRRAGAAMVMRSAIPHFREFHVGLATQHGYYPCMGDYIHPARPAWLAMQKDRNGAAQMSFDKIKARLAATREAGSRAAIYMHLTALDDSSEKFFPKLRSARLIGHDGQPVAYPWNGPDVKGGLWQMSMAAPEWRTHLLQQARWIMEIFQPDAIVVDETFTGLGYDKHSDRRGPLSQHSVGFFKQLHALVRSLGKDSPC